ncbi:hypothetical protein TRIP_B350063 [uncultured Desulfatiglans sp.]|nr:hypothetical protein TRIP_B350063 [uncultured Desulfatiglans sp.]
MAESFGVGRPAIREALRGLEIAGLVTIRQGREGGAYVQANNLDLIANHYSNLLRFGRVTLQHVTEARLFIETLMLDLVILKITPEDITKLRRCIDASEKALRLGKAVERAEHNLNFHCILSTITENPIIILNISSIMDLMSYFVLQIKTTKKISLNTIEAHTRIVDFLEAGNLEEAKEQNALHIKDVSQRLKDKYEKLVEEGSISNNLLPTFEVNLK